MNDAQFQADHAPGSLTVTASAWPTLVLEPHERPGWLPSPLAYGLHLLGTEPLPPPGKEVLRGKRLESVAIDLLEEAGHPPLRRQVRVAHRALHALAWLDGLAGLDGEVVGYEIKVVDAQDYERDWHPAPLYPRLQAQAQAACGGHRLTLIVPLVVGYKTIDLGEIVEEPRRDDVVGVLEDAARDFLALLESGRLPTPDASLSSYRALQAITDLRDERVRMDGKDAQEWLKRWQLAQAVKAEGAAAEKVIKQAQAWFAAKAGDAAEIAVGTTIIRRKEIDCAARQVEAYSYWKWSFKESNT